MDYTMTNERLMKINPQPAYLIISADNITDLEERVNKTCENYGHVPVGGVEKHGMRIIQAVYRFNDA
jgi:hypothetical protein